MEYNNSIKKINSLIMKNASILFKLKDTCKMDKKSFESCKEFYKNLSMELYIKGNFTKHSQEILNDLLLYTNSCIENGEDIVSVINRLAFE